MKKLFLFLISYSISFQTCFSQKYIGTDIRPSTIHKTGYLKPYSAIDYLKEKNEDDLSNKLNETIVQKSSMFLNEIFMEFELPAELVTLDSVDCKLYGKLIESIIKNIILDGEILKYNDMEVFSYNRKTVTKVINKIIISDSVFNIIKKSEKRLMLSTGTLGYIKTKNYRSKNPNKANNYANFGMGYGLVGHLIDNPNKCCKSINYAIIIDSEAKNIAYFHVIVDEVNSANEKDLKVMCHKIFEDYWIWYNSEADKYLKIKRK